MKAGYIVFSFGLIIVVYEIAYIILFLAGYDVHFLAWLDRWGPVAGWIMRAVILIIAGLMIYWGRRKTNASETRP